MVTYDKNEKDLVIPSALGLAGMQDSVCGVTEQEVIEIVESAITDYDTEIQVDLEDIRENVSGNTDDIASLSAATEALEQRVDNISTSALTQQIEALSDSVEDIRADVNTLSGDTDSIRTDVAALSAQTSENTATIAAGFPLLKGQVGALNARTSAITEQITELSAATSGIAVNVAALSGSTVAVEQAVAGKQDALSAGNGIDISGATISVKAGEGLGFSGDTLVVSGISGGNKNYYVDWATLYNADYSPRRAMFVELVEKYEDGYNIYVSGTTAASNGLDVILPMVSFKKGTYQENYGYSGGWAIFGGLPHSGNSGYWRASFSSSGNIAPSNAYLNERNDFYRLPTASSYTLGGIKVGSGLTIDGAGVLSAEGGGAPQPVVLNDILSGTQAEIQAFYDEMKPLISGSTSEGWDFNLFWRYEVYDNTYNLAPFSTAWVNKESAFGNENITFIFEYVGYATNFPAASTPDRVEVEISSDGTYELRTYGGRGIPSSIPQPAFVRFGNDERGRLTYNADNDVFYYGNITIPTGDTTTVYADLIDYALTNNLFAGALIDGTLFSINLNDLTVIKNGVSKVYAHPVLSRVGMSSPVTIDGVDFYNEITYNYGDYILTALYADGNSGANLRITAV